jgi:transcriptional regulator with XRE-family HTH domain
MHVKDLDEIDRIIGRNMAFYRKREELTPRQLGGMLGMTARHIQECERGKSPLPASRLPIVCEVLGICLGQLLGAEEPGSGGNSEALI